MIGHDAAEAIRLVVNILSIGWVLEALEQPAQIISLPPSRTLWGGAGDARTGYQRRQAGNLVERLVAQEKSLAK